MFLEHDGPIDKFKYLEENSLCLENKILLEDYFGKNPQLIRIEILFKTLTDRISKDKGKIDITTSGKEKIGVEVNFNTHFINETKELREIENILAKMFGFEEVNITVLGSTASANALTIPFYWSMGQMEFETITSKTGIKFKNPKDKVLNIFLFEYNFTSFTPEQNTAILLHEVGHNFFLTNIYIRKFFMILGTINNILTSVEDLTTNAGLRLPGESELDALQRKVIKLLMAVGGLSPSNSSKIFSVVAKLPIVYHIAKLKDVVEYVKEFLKRLVGWSLIVSIDNLINLIKNVSYCLNGILIRFFLELMMRNYSNEKYADSFATSYGYGKEVAEVFSTEHIKFSKASRDISQVPVFSFIDKYCTLITSVFFQFGDPHPSGMARCKIAKEKLEYELKNNMQYMTESQIRTIKNDIVRISNIIDNSEKQNPELSLILNGVDSTKDIVNTLGTSDRDVFETSIKVADQYLKI